MRKSFHDEAELWAAAAATGGLTEAELQAWSDHFSACPECKKLNDENLAMANLIKKTLDPESPAPGFEQRILLRLNQTRIGKGNRWYEFLLFHPPLATVAAGVALAVLFAGGWFIHREKPASIGADLGGLPTAVRSAIQHQAEGRAVVHVQRNEGAGPVSYTVTTKAPTAGEADFTVAENGTLLSSDITLAAVPPAVQKAINAQVGAGKIEGIEENFGDGNTTYVATIVRRDGQERDFTFNGDGTLASMEVSLSELPAPITAAVKAQAAQGEIGAIDKTFEAGGTTYTATIVARDGRQRDITFREDGTLAAMDITSSETPTLVRTAIEAQVSQGRLLGGVVKVFEKSEIVYQVTMAGPDGRWHDASFDALGRPRRPHRPFHRPWRRPVHHHRPNLPPPHHPGKPATPNVPTSIKA